MSDGLSYQDRRPTVVPARLGDLTGPTRGVVERPLAVAWTGRRTYDLDVPEDLAVLYERVIVEAATTADLTSLLNQDLLLRLWPALYLPRQIRSQWQTRFPSLSTAA